MSVQLILFPQNYEGQYSSISTPYFNEYVSDYSFNIGTLGSGFSGTANTQDHMYSKLSPSNIWQQFNATGGAYTTANAATISSGKIILNSATASGANFSQTGIYQLISNLTIGSTYVLKVQRLAGTTGVSSIGHTNSWSNSGIQYHPITFAMLPNTVGTHTFTFTASHTEEVFSINYYNQDNTNLEIGEVSIQESVGSAPTTDIFKDGQVICDLYNESYIPLSLSIDDFKNVHEKKQSFSKPFKLPATKRNNQIFTSLFDVTKSVKDDAFSFHPYKKTKAILKEDSFTIFEGYLKLIDITDKDGEISYNVNLYSDTITLADTLKDKKFSDINFSELLHEYNRTNILASSYDTDGVTLVNSLSTSSFAYNATLGTSKTDVIKYPFCKWNGDTYVDANDGKVKMEKLEDAFRPFINCKYLLDRIITEAGFTYSSDFLNSTDFTKLFMDFNWGEGITPTNPYGMQTMSIAADYTLPTSAQPTQFTTGSVPTGFDTSTNVFTCSNDNQNVKGTITFQIVNTGSQDVLGIEVLHTDTNDNTISSIVTSHTLNTNTSGIPHTVTRQYDFTLNNGDKLKFRTDLLNNVSGITVDKEYYHSGTGITLRTRMNMQLSSDVEMLEALTIARGDLKQWDFIKGFFDMFHLIALQDKTNPNNLIIEPYEHVFITAESQYITSKTLTWTNKVDISEIKLNPLKLKKNVLFEYTEDKDDYPKNVYFGTTGQQYGTKFIPNNELTALDGEEKIKTIYSSTFIKPAFSNFTDSFTIPVIYKDNEDGTFTGFKNKPRILYNNGRKDLPATSFILIPAQNGVSGANTTRFLQFSHLTDIPTIAGTKDYNFETGYLISSIGNIPVDNLYNEYWSPYYDELYNPDTKILKLKIYLTPADIANFEFYYKIRIKNREYRVNKIEYKPYELSSVELILIP
jgi:hypothetical protein